MDMFYKKGYIEEIYQTYRELGQETISTLLNERIIAFVKNVNCESYWTCTLIFNLWIYIIEWK